jgi:hypothetical protein
VPLPRIVYEIGRNAGKAQDVLLFSDDPHQIVIHGKTFLSSAMPRCTAPLSPRTCTSGIQGYFTYYRKRALLKRLTPKGEPAVRLNLNNKL